MMMLIILFAIEIIFLLILSRATSRALVNLLGDGWYAFLLWPGVIVHEISHLIGAVITLTPVRGFSVYPEGISNGGRVLGFVKHDQPRGAISLIIVSAMPFIGGTLALQFLTFFILPTFPQTIAIPNQCSLSSLIIFNQFVTDAWQAILLGGSASWLFLYLVLSISAHLAPSSEDLRHTITGLVGLFVAAILIIFIYILFKSTIIGTAFEWLFSLLSNLGLYFLPAMSFAIVLLIFTTIISNILFFARQYIIRNS